MSCLQMVRATLCSMAALMLFAGTASAAHKRILYVDSYHETYPWSAGITAGIQSVLASQSNIELKIFRMDTKRQPEEAAKIAAARQARDLIDRWRPDLVITSDDNAARYLIVPYFLNSNLPFVFCGINWNADNYRFPPTQITGMLEVQLIDEMLTTLRPFARGPRIAFIKGDDPSARKEADFFDQRFNLRLDRRLVKNFAEWQQAYRQLQQEADLILLGNNASIADWDADLARTLIMNETRVPTANWDAWMAPYSLVTFANLPGEQGEWAAATALRILNGTPVSAIPITTNHKAGIYLNMDLARKLGIKFPMELIERATFTSELE